MVGSKSPLCITWFITAMSQSQPHPRFQGAPKAKLGRRNGQVADRSLLMEALTQSALRNPLLPFVPLQSSDMKGKCSLVVEKINHKNN